MTRLSSLRTFLQIALIACVILPGTDRLHAQEQSGLLTVKKIYSQPGLGGRPYRGVQWAPDGKMVTFFAPNGAGKDAKAELWSLEISSGQRRLLVSAEKLETVLPAGKTQTQATLLIRIR